jgi:hypothetical protein
MPKQSFEEKIKAGKAKFKAIREGDFRLFACQRSFGVALRRSVKGDTYQEKLSGKY